MADVDITGVRYSELPKTLSPTHDDLIALLDNESNILKATPLQNAVNCTLGGHDISEIADGTVTGALVELDERRVVGALELTYDQYMADKEYYDAMDNFIIITDKYVIVMRADEVSYDNSSSHLNAETVQEAIDAEVSRAIGKSQLTFQLVGSDLYITKTY